MKNFNKRCAVVAGYGVIVIFLSITFWRKSGEGVRFEIMPLLWPFIIGFVLAYFLNFLLRLYERKIKKRMLALFLVYATVTTLLALFVYFLAPQVSVAMGHFILEFPDYSEQIINQIEGHLSNIQLTENHVETIGQALDELIVRFVNFNQNVIPRLLEKLEMIGQTLTHIALGIILSVYLLAKKEMLCRQLDKLVLSFLGTSRHLLVTHWTLRGKEIFKKFFAGMALTSLIVGVMTTTLLFIFRIPFAILIGFIVAITNVIPIFGPLIGGIPSVVMIFFISPTKAMVFVVLMVVIQQVDANIIVPKILGDKIGISPIWVLVAIIIFGFFGGVVGMIIGVPVMALLLEIMGHYINRKIDKMVHNGGDVVP